MFFIASKIVFFCIQPSSLAFIALGLALLLGYRHPRLARLFLLFGFGIILFFGFLPGGNVLVLPLEQRFASRVPPVPQEKISGIILLGGFRGWLRHGKPWRFGPERIRGTPYGDACASPARFQTQKSSSREAADRSSGARGSARIFGNFSSMRASSPTVS